MSTERKDNSRGYAMKPNDPADESKSRERFEKWATENKLVGLMIGLEFTDGNYVAEQLAKRWPTWRAAERDTRERCAQLLEKEAEGRSATDAVRYSLEFWAKRIRSRETK